MDENKGRPGMSRGMFDIEPRDEIDYFEACPVCGRAFDIRDWESLAYHETHPEHTAPPLH